MKKIVTDSSGRTLEINENVWTGKVKIFLNDIEAFKVRRNQYSCKIGDDHCIITKKGNSLTGLSVNIDGEEVEVIRKLNALELIVSFLPIVLVILGGAIGGFFGALAICLNLYLMRYIESIFVKIIVPIVVSLVTYFIVLQIIALVLPLSGT